VNFFNCFYRGLEANFISLQLNKPIPDDLVPILTKDQEKQKLIREKANKDAASAQARSIGVSSSVVTPSPSASRLATQTSSKLGSDTVRKAAVPGNGPTKSTSTNATATIPPKVPASKSQPMNTPAKPSMIIQAIPPFKKDKARTQPSNTSGNNASASNGPSTSSSVVPSTPASPTTANNRLNVNASSFRPNPKASVFSPVKMLFVYGL
jgi:hypothetical protein